MCAVQPQQSEKDFTININVPMTSGITTRVYFLHVRKLMYIMTSSSVELDFSVEGDSQLYFPSSGESQISCANLTITNEGLFENEEVFCLTLESSDLDVIINSTTAVTCITIQNINSKLYVVAIVFNHYNLFTCRS